MTKSRLDHLPLFAPEVGRAWSFRLDEDSDARTLARVLLTHRDGREVVAASFVKGVPVAHFEGWKARAMRAAWHACKALNIEEEKGDLASRLD